MSTGNGNGNRPRTGQGTTVQAIPRLVRPVPSTPYGADDGAMREGFAMLVPKIETLTGTVNKIDGELAEVKGVVIRTESKVDALAVEVRALVSRIGTYPLGDDAIKAMERESVREASPEAIAERDARLHAARWGTGLIGDIKRSDARLEAKDLDFERRAEAIEARLSAKVQTQTTQAVEGAIEDAKDVAKSGNRKAVVQGVSVAALVAALIGLVQALGGADGLTRIIHGP